MAIATRRAETPDASVQESMEMFTMIPELPDVHRCCWKAEVQRDRCLTRQRDQTVMAVPWTKELGRLSRPSNMDRKAD